VGGKNERDGLEKNCAKKRVRSGAGKKRSIGKKKTPGQKEGDRGGHTLTGKELLKRTKHGEIRRKTGMKTRKKWQAELKSGTEKGDKQKRGTELVDVQNAITRKGGGGGGRETKKKKTSRRLSSAKKERKNIKETKKNGGDLGTSWGAANDRRKEKEVQGRRLKVRWVHRKAKKRCISLKPTRKLMRFS